MDLNGVKVGNANFPKEKRTVFDLVRKSEETKLSERHRKETKIFMHQLQMEVARIRAGALVDIEKYEAKDKIAAGQHRAVTSIIQSTDSAHNRIKHIALDACEESQPVIEAGSYILNKISISAIEQVGGQTLPTEANVIEVTDVDD